VRNSSPQQEVTVSIKDRLQGARERIKAAINRARRPLDEDDREALNFLIEVTKDARKDGGISEEEIDEIIDAAQALRAARKNTPG